jgi:glyoxylase-like metal-dependent hydrolase (beta-lactamase superfamily II)
MAVAQEIDQVAPGIFSWQSYDPTVKADLFSTGLDTPSGTYLIDPVALKAESVRNLESGRHVSGIVITNENHERAASQFAKRFSVPIYLHAGPGKAVALPRTIELQDKAVLSPGLTALAIDGAPLGEIAIHYDADGGTMVVGDALINFEPYGFALLPAKYCRDFKQMRRLLPRLLDHSFQRILFAHGTPILSGAHARLERLLAANR